MKHNSSPFKWRHYEPTIILLCVRWYCRYQLSYRDLDQHTEIDCLTCVKLINSFTCNGKFFWVKHGDEVLNPQVESYGCIIQNMSTAEERLRNPLPGSRVEAARDFGIDLTLIIERLRKTPEERVRELQHAIEGLEKIRGKARRKPSVHQPIEKGQEIA